MNLYCEISNKKPPMGLKGSVTHIIETAQNNYKGV